MSMLPDNRFPRSVLQRVGIRAEAEDYADSLGLTPRTPEWGGAVRHFVLSRRAGFPGAGPNIPMLSKQTPDPGNSFGPGEPEALSVSAASPAGPFGSGSSFGLPPAFREMGHDPANFGLQLSMAAARGPSRKMRGASARTQPHTAATPRQPPKPAEDYGHVVETLFLPPSEWGGPSNDGTLGDRLHENRENDLRWDVRTGFSPAPPRGARPQPILTHKMRGDLMRWIPLAENPDNKDMKEAGRTAEGRFQITDPTWVDYYPRVFGNNGATRAQMLEAKEEGAYDEWVAAEILHDDANHLHSAGFAVDPTNLYLTHFAGWPKGLNILRHPDWPVTRLLTAKEINGNGIPRNWKGKQLIDWARGKIETAAARDRSKQE